jgi:four helix bundle protein
MKVYSFEKLRVWVEAKDYAVFLYQLTLKFPKDEKYSITDQIRRAGTSIPSNIAEGSSRSSTKDQAYFYNISHASLMETLNHLLIAKELNYITNEDLETARTHIDSISAMLSGLRNSVLNSKR